jgi:hypothetical protein
LKRSAKRAKKHEALIWSERAHVKCENVFEVRKEREISAFEVRNEREKSASCGVEEVHTRTMEIFIGVGFRGDDDLSLEGREVGAQIFQVEVRGDDFVLERKNRFEHPRHTGGRGTVPDNGFDTPYHQRFLAFRRACGLI